MDAVQRMRARAYADRKKLITTKEQVVSVKEEQNRQVISIETAAPATLYVPLLANRRWSTEIGHTPTIRRTPITGLSWRHRRRCDRDRSRVRRSLCARTVGVRRILGTRRLLPISWIWCGSGGGGRCGRCRVLWRPLQ